MNFVSTVQNEISLTLYWASRKLTWPMADPTAGYVIPQLIWMVFVALYWCLSCLANAEHEIRVHTYNWTVLIFLPHIQCLHPSCASFTSVSFQFHFVLFCSIPGFRFYTFLSWIEQHQSLAMSGVEFYPNFCHFYLLSSMTLTRLSYDCYIWSMFYTWT